RKTRPAFARPSAASSASPRPPRKRHWVRPRWPPTRPARGGVPALLSSGPGDVGHRRRDHADYSTTGRSRNHHTRPRARDPQSFGSPLIPPTGLLSRTSARGRLTSLSEAVLRPENPRFSAQNSLEVLGHFGLTVLRDNSCPLNKKGTSTMNLDHELA